MTRFTLGMTHKTIHCCGCAKEVSARFTNGAEVYPHRFDLAELPFWKCDTCKNFVGCHYQTKTPTRPLGCIPTPEMKKARQAIHKLLDPLWKNGKMKRQHIYASLSLKLGRDYHTAELRSVDEARQVYRWVQEIAA